MKQLLFFLLIGYVALMLSCTKGNTLPPYSASTIFSVNAKMTHAKDTIRSAGDTIWVTAQGNINDTTGTYSISANLKAVDASSNLISGKYFKNISPAFDTAGLAASKLYHWKATLPFPIPAVTPKTVITITGVFNYGLSLSSETGNQVGTDSKTTYAQ